MLTNVQIHIHNIQTFSNPELSTNRDVIPGARPLPRKPIKDTRAKASFTSMPSIVPAVCKCLYVYMFICLEEGRCQLSVWWLYAVLVILKDVIGEDQS